MKSLSQEIERETAKLPEPLPDGAAERLARLLRELEKWNRRINLTAIRGSRQMIAAHVLDSLAALPLLAGDTVLDVGCGAGFPGLPLAIADPGREFTLLDSNRRKIQFVEHAAGMLSLDNVSAVAVRSEGYAPGHRFDTVIARALATIPKLLEMAGHHVREDGVFVALKGRYPAEELKDVRHPWSFAVTELSVPGLAEGSRHAVSLRRQAS